jgi:hypothetical protein
MLILNGNDGTRNLMCVANFYLKPEHDGNRVKEALHDTALTSVYLHPRRSILVVADEKPYGTHYRLKAYPNDPRDQFKFTTDLTIRGKQAVMALGAKYASVDLSESVDL